MGRPNKPAALIIIDLISLSIHKVLPWLLAVWLVIAVRDAAMSLSGEGSLFRAWVELTSNLRVSRGFAFVFGVFGIVYGLRQRSLRETQYRHLSQRISELEASAKRP